MDGRIRTKTWGFDTLLLPFLVVGVVLGSAPQLAAAVDDYPSITAFTQGMEAEHGFFSFYFDEETGRLFLEMTDSGREFLYLNSLATGIGWGLNWSLDRGTTGEEALVRFERTGTRMLLVRSNTTYRAMETENSYEVRAVEESFPTSTLGAFSIVAREGDRFLVDATDFFLQDRFDVRRRIREAGQGTYVVNPTLSSIYRQNTRTFPSNTEIQAVITLASDEPGPAMRRVAPDARQVTVRQHHSFVELPDDNYRPRVFNPRVGIGAVLFYDFAQSLEAGVERRFIRRWRLEKEDPDADLSEPVEPIVFYMDRGTPEPYKTAFQEGISWWNEAMQAAGFENGVLVRDLPEGIDPMDARFSVVQWVHRNDYGPSVGPSFRDPRTGEILRAAVRMDSHRSLTNFNTFAAVRAGSAPASDPEDGGLPLDLDWVARLDPDVSAEEFAMARRRQHAAHEVAHTLGLSHNLIAASYGRASCVDNPAPLIRLRDDSTLDLSEAYEIGCGAYDRFALAYAYTPFSPEEEEEGLHRIIQDGIDAGIEFITGGDADPVRGTIPLANMWINGEDMLEELDRVTEIRSLLLERFNESAIEPGDPMWLLNQRLAPVYFYHRYTLESVIKAIGGFEFQYTVRGFDQPHPRIIDGEVQRASLAAVVDALQPEALAIPDRVIELMHPPPFGYSANDRAFQTPAGPAFDPLAAAGSLANYMVEAVFHPERVARLVSFSARDATVPSFHDVTDRLLQEFWHRPHPQDRMEAALLRVTQRVLVDALLRLAQDAEATSAVRGMAEFHLARLHEHIRSWEDVADHQEAAHRRYVTEDIRRFLERSADPTLPSETLRHPSEWPIGG